MIYIADPGTPAAQVEKIAAEQGLLEAFHLSRRGCDLGWCGENARPAIPDATAIKHAWHHDETVMLPGILLDAIAHHDKNIEQAHRLMEATLDGAEVASLFEAEPYASQLQRNFALVATSFEEHDPQGIEKLLFDACEYGEIIAENLWCKASWLSFHDEDASLRFRFSFGMEGFEDVAADPSRQHLAGKLCSAIFPESRAITENSSLGSLLRAILGSDPAYVERIVYFNAPNGGAQMHHDVERGHAGVVYGQLSGSTFWLAAAKPVLMDELITFARSTEHAPDIEAVLAEPEAREAFHALLSDRRALAEYMEEQDHELVEAVLDRSPAFIHHMVKRGYGYMLKPGDALLMPQRDVDTCVWHTVFCLDDEPGEALSFAIRGDDGRP
ncbi:MAG: hypothetical protein ACE5F3_05100 [Mariprofundaceae bacterium]